MKLDVDPLSNLRVVQVLLRCLDTSVNQSHHHHHLISKTLKELAFVYGTGPLPIATHYIEQANAVESMTNLLIQHPNELALQGSLPAQSMLRPPFF